MRRFLCLIFVLLIFLLVACREKVYYSAQHHQPLDNIVKIELLNTDNQSKPLVLYTLDEAEHEAFLSELMSFQFEANGTPPKTDYGPLSVRLYYEDGYSDVIGMCSNWYLDPNGEKVGGHYWYSLVETQDYYTLFSHYYENTALLPYHSHYPTVPKG